MGVFSMKVESSSTSYVNGNYSNKGFSGLASGVDTESMVQQMLSGIQTKIDKQQGLKQQTLWKQEIYRSVIDDIQSFKSKYFDRLSSGNLMDSNFFSTMKAVSSSDAVKVTATTEAASGISKIEVAQLASAASLRSGSRVTGAMTGTLDIKKLAAAGEDGKLLLPEEGELTLQVKLNGVQKAVNIDLGKLAKDAGLTGVDLENATEAQLKAANQKLAAALEKGINQVHGSSIKVSEKNGVLTLTGSDLGQEIAVGGSTALLDAIGMKSGQSNKLSLTSTLGETNFAEPLSGERFVLNINGKEFTFSADTQLREVIAEINSSDAGVRLTYNSLQDKFNIESTSTGAGIKIDMSQSEGNLLTAMFGNAYRPGSQVSAGISRGDITGDAPDGKIEDGVFTLMVDGKKTAVKLTGVTEENIVDKLNTALAGEFGNEDIQVKKNDDGTYSLVSPKDRQVSFASVADTDLAAKMGFKGKDNLVGKQDDLTLGELGITLDSARGVDANTKLSELEEKSGGRYSFDAATSRIVLNSKMGDRNLNDDEKAIFGDVKLAGGLLDTSKPQLNKPDVTEGKNALVSIDGVWTERATNGFTVNGLYLELKDTTGEYEMGDPNADGTLNVTPKADAQIKPVTIDASRDTEQIYTRITDFVKDYNTLIDRLNGLVDEEASYKEYAPLTSDQKKEMSDREIELWEEKAKEGLLRRDSAISTFLSDMRTALYQRPAGSPIALYDIGIDTSSEWRDKGKLTVNETALRAAIEQNPTEVMNLFTDAEGGISARMSEAIKRAANDSSGSPGTLVQIAGMKNRGTDTNNDLYERMKQIDQQISRLQNQYSQQKTRYWNQFNAMEKMISNMNTQSAWLSQMLGG